MKKLLILLIITSFFGCKKEKAPTLSGEWKFVKACDAYGCTPVDQAYSSSIRFYNGGKLEFSGSYNPLSEFDHYEIINEQTVRFFSTVGNFQADAHCYFESGLLLSFV